MATTTNLFNLYKIARLSMLNMYYDIYIKFVWRRIHIY